MSLLSGRALAAELLKPECLVDPVMILELMTILELIRSSDDPGID